MHMRVKHPTECVCGLCGSTFATTRGLSVHNMSQHRQETNEGNGPNCEVCGVKFATVIAWKKHLVLSSKHEVSNGCEFCGETFADEASLKLHLKKHARKQSGRVPPVQIPSKCVICAEWLTSRDQYKTHMTSLHPLSAEAKRIDFVERKKPGSVICEVCGKMVKSKSLLVYHQRKHTGERPLQCSRCDKRFDAPATLHAHVYARHTNVNLPCHMCHKRFSNRNALAKHIKIHLGIRPYKCSICNKAFPHLCDVKVHMKHAHYKVPWPKKRDRNKQKTENTETE
ncbi:zinc finger protein 26-like [Hyposmocoma kahamanoa]|uniref:zinc finger protein 26-like n=1 Tax=Hyposmocoma kahamanoa TaxID=1477025 RepID=UPI000E6D9177|nr:zinc finger protein 26-like [Hyposmocoma kahamanoa]